MKDGLAYHLNSPIDLNITKGDKYIYIMYLSVRQ